MIRRADAHGVVSFARSAYACGRQCAQVAVQVSIVAGSVQPVVDGKVVRVHPIRHDRAKELRVFAAPSDRPRHKPAIA